MCRRRLSVPSNVTAAGDLLPYVTLRELAYPTLGESATIARSWWSEDGRAWALFLSAFS